MRHWCGWTIQLTQSLRRLNPALKVSKHAAAYSSPDAEISEEFSRIA
jgi:hypothetical protein